MSIAVASANVSTGFVTETMDTGTVQVPENPSNLPVIHGWRVRDTLGRERWHFEPLQDSFQTGLWSLGAAAAGTQEALCYADSKQRMEAGTG